MSGRHSDERWRRLSIAYRRANPTCMDPSGCTAPSEDVHHLDGQGLHGPRAYDWSNLEALCHSHHSKRTAQEQPAGWHRAQRTPRKRPAKQHPGLIT